MKFKIKLDVLKEGLGVVNHAVANITTSPILETILLKVEHGNLTLVSNNLEMAIEYVINDDINIDTDGSFAVPSKLFTSLISLINDPEIEIELLGNDNLKIKTQNGDTKIKGIDAQEFPLIPIIKEESSIEIKGDLLKESIEKTIFSSAEGNIRPTLAGIYINIKENDIAFASTDSFRLSEYKTKIEKKSDMDFSQIIPNKTANEIKNIIKDNDNIKIISGHNQIGFYFSNIKVYSRLLNGKFPDYTNFFPTTHSTKAVVDRADLIQALKRVNLISRENNYSIRINFNERTLVLETGESQIGEGEVKVDASLDGDENIIGINSVYFLEVLGVIGTSHVEISFENALSPVFIRQVDDEKKKSKGEFRHIIMPLKI